MVRRACALALLLAAAVARGEPKQRPSFSIQAGGVVAAALPPFVLQETSVRKQLGSGLTTTFLVVARQRETREITGARMEVRYDLWDEVWLVKRVEFDGRTDRQKIASSDALEKWWRAPVRLLSTDADRVSLQVDLRVLPFSAAEEQDAREWITKSGGMGTPAGGGGSRREKSRKSTRK